MRVRSLAFYIAFLTLLSSCQGGLVGTASLSNSSGVSENCTEGIDCATLPINWGELDIFSQQNIESTDAVDPRTQSFSSVCFDNTEERCQRIFHPSFRALYGSENPIAVQSFQLQIRKEQEPFVFKGGWVQSGRIEFDPINSEMRVTDLKYLEYPRYESGTGIVTNSVGDCELRNKSPIPSSLSNPDYPVGYESLNNSFHVLTGLYLVTQTTAAEDNDGNLQYFDAHLSGGKINFSGLLRKNENSFYYQKSSENSSSIEFGLFPNFSQPDTTNFWYSYDFGKEYWDSNDLQLKTLADWDKRVILGYCLDGTKTYRYQTGDLARVPMFLKAQSRRHQPQLK